MDTVPEGNGVKSEKFYIRMKVSPSSLRTGEQSSSSGIHGFRFWGLVHVPGQVTFTS